MIQQMFNDFILSPMLLHKWRHRSVTIATTELSNVLLSPMAECRLDDATLKSMWHHSYDDRSMTSFVKEHGMLHQFFSDIRNRFFLHKLEFLKQIFFLKSFNSMLYINCTIDIVSAFRPESNFILDLPPLSTTWIWSRMGVALTHFRRDTHYGG